MAAPLSSFPEGDPRNALYHELEARNQHAYERGKAAREEQLSNARTNTQYGLGQVRKGEPEGFRNLRNRANKGGVLHSGIEARRTGNLQMQYAARRYALEHGLTETEGRLGREGKGAEESYNENKAINANKALAENRQYAEENPQLGLNAAAKAELEGKPPPAPSAVKAAAARRVVGGKYVTKIVNGKPHRVYQAF